MAKLVQVALVSMQPSKSGILNNVLNERFIRRMVGCWLERGSAIIQPRLLYRHQFNTISGRVELFFKYLFFVSAEIIWTIFACG